MVDFLWVDEVDENERNKFCLNWFEILKFLKILKLMVFELIECYGK